MATVSKSSSDYKSLYTGFDSIEVGLGTIAPNIFATKDYKKKKIDKLLIGGLHDLRYTGSENDLHPLVLVIGYEPAYNTAIGFNLHYVPKPFRNAIINIVLKGNHARIKGQRHIVVDYKRIAKAIPEASKIIRRYKLQGIKVVNSYPLVEWDEAIKRKSRWQNWYKSKKK